MVFVCFDLIAGDAGWLANHSYLTVTPNQQNTLAADDEAIVDNAAPASDDSSPPAKREKHSRKSPSHKSKHKKEKKQKKDKKSKKHQKHKADETPSSPEQRLEFTGTENYYVDKKPGKRSQIKREHNALNYKVDAWLGARIRHKPNYLLRSKPQRYYQMTIDKQSNGGVGNEKARKLTEDEFTAQTKEFNKNLLSHHCQNVDMWLEFIELQEKFHMRLSKVQLAERKFEILNKALRSNTGDDRLYDKYIDILEKTFPSFEVSQYLDGLIEKDPANYSLWNAQLMTSQSSMARCNVPDMLNLYEKCMKNMYKWNRRDEITLSKCTSPSAPFELYLITLNFTNFIEYLPGLFNSCSLYLRQSGLSEKFFALLTLALDLNYETDKFGRIKINTNEQTLIEYEELILASGLPMSELWLRIENLRQNFYFLPCTATETNDPYRIVTNKDICYYIYPLSKQANIPHLALIILRLLKVPLPNSHPVRVATFNACDASGRDNYCDLDAIEELATFFIGRTILKPCKVFDDILWSMIREFCNGPSYLTTLIGHEMYIKYLNEILLTCAGCYAIDNPDTLPLRDVFIALLVRLERIVILFDVYMNKWTDEKDKKYRSKMKGIIRYEQNRNCAAFYVEYGKIEYALDRMESAEKVFMATLSQMNPRATEKYARAEYWNAAISYVEILMAEQQINKCQQILLALALDTEITDIESIQITDANYLLASNNLQKRVRDACSSECNGEVVTVFEYLQPNYTLCAIKAYIYHLFLWRKDKTAMFAQLHETIQSFMGDTEWNKFMRENLYELLVNLLQYKFAGSDSFEAETIEIEKGLQSAIKNATLEFPSNMALLQYAVVTELRPWHQVRSMLVDNQSPIALIFLAVGAQLRYQKYSMSLITSNQMATNDLQHILAVSTGIQDLEKAYKTRVINIFRESTEQNETTKKCSLLWRLYLRSLFETPQNMENCREIILKGLNECPWNKVGFCYYSMNERISFAQHVS